MSVTRKLYLLVALGLLAAGLISAVAIYGVVTMSRASHSLFDNALQVTKNVSRLIVEYEKGRALVHSVSLESTPAQVQTAAERFDKVDQDVADASIDVFRSITDARMRDLVTEFIAHLDESRHVAQGIFQAWSSNNSAFALLLTDQYIGSEAKFQTAITRLSQYVEELSDQELGALERTRNLIVDAAILVALLAPVLIGIALLMARQIARPLLALTNAARKVEQRAFEPNSIDTIATQKNELGTLARVFRKMAIDVQRREEHLNTLVQRRTNDLEEKNELLERSQKRMETELQIAQAVQIAILPQELAPHESYSGKAVMIPARELGGDFYDFFLLDDEQIGLVIADVSGKGVPAAFFMAIARTVLHSSARDQREAGECLAMTNTSLCNQNPLDMFVTAFYGIIDLETGLFRYSNAGHNLPIVIRRDGRIEFIPATAGVAMGVMPSLAYREATLQLEVGDTVFLYTDGISEAMDAHDEEFTTERLVSSLEGSHLKTIDAVVEDMSAAVKAFVGDAPQSDDMTYLILRYDGPPKAAAGTMNRAA